MNKNYLAVLLVSLGLVLFSRCDSSSESERENPPAVAVDSGAVVPPEEVIEAPPRPIANQQESIESLAISLKTLAQQLDDSLEYTSAPAEVQEELLLTYKQLGNRARQAHRSLQPILADSNQVKPQDLEAIRAAKELEDEIIAFLTETEALY